jgi:ATP-binding cassette subfamily B protein
MRTDYGYFEEKKLGKPYDLKLLKRLYPFFRSYRMWLLGSVLLVVLITFLELAIPYVTKIAIDRFIVPVEQEATPAGGAAGRDSQHDRYITVQASPDELKALQTRFPEEIAITGNQARIPYELLSRLDPNELKQLRQKDLKGLNDVVLVFLFIIVLNFGCNFIQVMIMEYTGHRIMHDMRIALYAHLQQLSIGYFTRNPVGRLVTRVTNDVQNMHELFTSIITFVFKDLFLLVGIAVVLISISWKLALATFVVLPFVGYASFKFAERAREIFRELRVKIAEINTMFAESISGINVIQLFLAEKRNYQRFANLNHENYQAGMKQIRLLAVFMPLVEFLGIVTIAIIIYYGGYNVVEGGLSLGALVAFISYIRMFFRPIRDIAEKYNILQNAMASAERIFLIFDTTELDHLGPSAQAPFRAGRVDLDNSYIQDQDLKIQSVRFQNVSFAYVADEPVLKSVSFELKQGQTMAVVGPTGAGKTTLMYLLSGFYQPDSGQILVNGSPLQLLNVQQLRSRMAIVMQDPFLFSDTIRSNIFKGEDTWSPERVDDILTASNCKDFIEKLPQGLDTILSEGGGSLSSGQRQLICIARAFAHNPDLIILDEATSYIDSETEVKIQSALSRLMQNRTCIVIAHRLSTAQTADQIMVLHQHRIIESGSHQELMHRKGFYFRLHQAQAR